MLPAVVVRFALAALALCALAWAPAAPAQVKQCVTPEGQQIFTDRSCAEVGGTERAPPRTAASTQNKPGGGCARSVDDLVFEMTGAFDAHDANRLAGVYHWTGMSGTGAYDVMARLDALVQRPLLDIVRVMPEEPEPAEPAPPFPAFDDSDAEPAPPPRPRAPVALRIEQTLGNSITPSRTVFGLQKHFGCWWIKG